MRRSKGAVISVCARSRRAPGQRGLGPRALCGQPILPGADQRQCVLQLDHDAPRGQNGALGLVPARGGRGPLRDQLARALRIGFAQCQSGLFQLKHPAGIVGFGPETARFPALSEARSASACAMASS